MTTDNHVVAPSQLLAVFIALKEHGVEYAVFGAVALGFHGLARATADLDLFVAPSPKNIDRLKAALTSLYDDPSIEEISSEELCGEYPAVRYVPPDGFGFDILTRLGEAFRFEDLEIEERTFEGISVRVVTAQTLWHLKKDTVRPVDRMDAAALQQRFGFSEG
jgi:hypothetical protein